MAPKKSLLVLTTIVLLTGLATANSFEDTPEDEVWLNNDAQINFEVKYSDSCDSEKKTKILDSDDNEVASFEAGEEGENTNEDEIVYEHSYEFDEDETGSYTIEVSCAPEDDLSGDEEPETVSKEIEVGDLELSLSGVPEETVYEGDDLGGEIDVETNNDNLEDIDYEYRFNDADKEVLEIDDGSFVEEAYDSDFETFEVFASPEGHDFEESDSAEVDIQDVWQIKDLQVSADEEIDDDDYTVKYRNLDQLQLNFEVTKSGGVESGFGSSDFLFKDESDWFDAEDNSGDYTLNIDGRPVMDDLGVDDQYVWEVVLEDDKLDERLSVANITVERDVEFSGDVFNVRGDSVKTYFEAEYDGRARNFETNDGYFEKYINTGEVDMLMDFPKASVKLHDMKVDKEDPGDISHNYYDDIEESNLETEGFPDGVRPVNLAAFISNYDFEADSRAQDTYVDMEFDTSDIRPEDVVVYECNEWTFRAEECSGDWEEISNNDITLESGATWNAKFPITPRESERFSGDEGVLSNAYLVGVPEGVGSELTLEDSLDVGGFRIASGENFEASGKVIDEATGDAVEGVDVDIQLSGPEDVSFEASTDSSGEFEVSGQLDEAGSYDVMFSAVNPPYESFEQDQSDAVEVFYETGLAVSSESSPDVALGEDYDIEYSVENTGQASVEDIGFDVSGVDESDYELSPSSIGSLDVGESRDVVLTLNLAEDLRTPPTISFEASGVSDGEDVSAGPDTTSVSFSDEVDFGSEGEENGSEETESESSSLPDVEEISQATGEFIESQSDMNLALGLIFVFGAILAVAVRKQKNGDGDRDRMNGRMNGGMAAGGRGRGSRVQKPQVAPEKVEPEEVEQEQEDDKEDEEAEDEQKESEEDSDEASNEDQKEQESSENESSEDEDFVCDTCGESFDTESGLKLHRQALH